MTSTKVLTCPHCQAKLDLSFQLSVWSLKPANTELWRKIPVTDMALSIRTINCLKTAKEDYFEDAWDTAGDLDDKSDNAILRLPNAGKKTLQEIREIISNLKEESADAQAK
jgi:DNA-directed RNA polymerase alpha subunit